MQREQVNSKSPNVSRQHSIVQPVQVFQFKAVLYMYCGKFII